MKIDRALINGTIVTSEGRFRGGIGIRDGRIAAITEGGNGFTGGEIIDVAGNYILPGVIDAHIHFQDPGFTHREDFEHGTAACAVGGITTAISHPMNDPAVVDVESYQANLDAYRGRAVVDYGLHGGGTADNVEEVESLWSQTGATAVKMFMCFSVKEFPFVQDDAMFEILERLARQGGLAIIHAENEGLIRQKEQQLKAAGRRDPMAYNESRPAYVEIEAVRRAIVMLEQTGAAALIAHVSTARALEEIRAARERGVRIWAESCPHFFTFVDEDMNRLGPFLKFSPVMHDDANRKRLWELLEQGYIHTLGSDHCPFAAAEKEAGLQDIWKAPNGIPGLEVMLPVFLDGVNRGLLSFERLVEVTSRNPARLYGMAPAKGDIRPGADADLVVVDMGLTKSFSAMERKSKCPWSPYEGMTLKGWPVMTYVRGELVADHGRICVSPGYGRYVPRPKGAREGKGQP
ncbi:MAG: dihydroorotase [Desulfobacterales bacterium]|nr:dihydroorotase [Desulfobacterales bacterium]